MTKSPPQTLPSRASPTSGAAEGGLPAAAVLKQLSRVSNFYSHLGPQGAQKGEMTASDWLTNGENLAPAGLGDSRFPLHQVHGPCGLRTLSSCVPFRAPGPDPRRDSWGLGSCPSWLVLPGPDHEEGVGRQ